jgi:hypothetical protein
MATVDEQVSALTLPDIPGRIEFALDYLRNEWEGVPELAAEWAEWDEHSRLSFAVDWPIRESHLHLLQEWAQQGLLTADQQTRYKALLELIVAQRPALERLLND